MDFNDFVANTSASERDGCLKRGMLSKKGKDGKKWAPRLFVLREGRLYYYKTKAVSIPLGPSRGSADSRCEFQLRPSFLTLFYFFFLSDSRRRWRRSLWE
jgi:hypothetical protein